MTFRRTTSRDDVNSGDTRRAARDEESVRGGFWSKVRRVAHGLPFAEDLLAAYYCAFDRRTPTQVRVALLGALGYFVLPCDAMPDVLPLVGYTDDAAVLTAAVALVAEHIRPAHREAARRALASETHSATAAG
jgi:uncharacterized membrane protein YkvA (DUF1232 family)